MHQRYDSTVLYPVVCDCESNVLQFLVRRSTFGAFLTSNRSKKLLLKIGISPNLSFHVLFEHLSLNVASTKAEICRLSPARLSPGISCTRPVLTEQQRNWCTVFEQGCRVNSVEHKYCRHTRGASTVWRLIKYATNESLRVNLGR